MSREDLRSLDLRSRHCLDLMAGGWGLGSDSYPEVIGLREQGLADIDRYGVYRITTAGRQRATSRRD